MLPADADPVGTSWWPLSQWLEVALPPLPPFGGANFWTQFRPNTKKPFKVPPHKENCMKTKQPTSALTPSTLTTATTNYWPPVFLAAYVYLLNPVISVLLTIATFRQSSLLNSPTTPLRWWQIGIVSLVIFSYFLGLSQTAKAAIAPNSNQVHSLFMWLFWLIAVLLVTSLFAVA